MSRKAKPITCNESDINDLEMLASGGHVLPAIRQRARAILLCADGKENSEIASQLGVRANSVGEWRRAYAEGGIQGLMNRPRSGRRGNAKPDPKAQVLELAKGGPSAEKKLTAKEIGDRLGTSPDTVRRILRGCGETLSKPRNWYLRADMPTLQHRVDIAGLYLSNKAKAIVLCMSDEEMECTQGKIYTRSAKKAKFLEDYYDDTGNIPLIDSLNVLSDKTFENIQTSKLELNPFLASCLEKSDKDSNVIYQVIIFKEESYKIIALNSPNITIISTSDAYTWMNYTESWLKILCEEKRKIVEAIHKHIEFEKISPALNEPFIWSRSDIVLKRNGCVLDDKDIINEKWEKNVLFIQATIKTSSGEEIKVEKKVFDALPDFDDINYDSALGFASSTETITEEISKAFKSVNRTINECYINKATLKKKTVLA